MVKKILMVNFSEEIISIQFPKDYFAYTFWNIYNMSPLNQ